MKCRRIVLTSVAVMSVLLLGGCVGPFADDDGSEHIGGTLTINLSDAMTAQALLPDLDMNPVNYSIAGSGPSNQSFELTTGETSVTLEKLAFGEWTIAVSALNAGGTMIGSGATTVTVITGETVTAAVTVVPIEGVGTLDISVDWNEGDIQIPSIESRLIPVTGVAAELAFFLEDSRATYRSDSTATGYHTLTLQLLDNGIVTAGAVEVVRIADGATTRGSYLFDQVNKPGGAIDVEIIQEMAEPLTVIISGGEATVEEDQTLSLGAGVTESVSTAYVWYVNGASVAAGDHFDFVAEGYGPGYYRIDVTAFSADGTRAGSATVSLEVIEASFQPELVPVSVESTIGSADSIYVDENIIMVGTTGGELHLSRDNGDSWSSIPTSEIIPQGYIDTVLATPSGTLIVGATIGGGLSYSDDGGQTWSNLNSEGTGIPSWNIHSLAYTDGRVFAGAWPGGWGNGGLAFSDDDGVSWTILPSTTAAVRRVFAYGETVIIASNGGVHLSSDGGSSWKLSTTSDGLPHTDVMGVDYTDGIVWASTYGGGIAWSDDYGDSWSVIDSSSGLASDDAWGIRVIDQVVYVATGNGLSVSTDGGTSWQTYLHGNFCRDLYVYGNEVFVAAGNLHRLQWQ